jgi:hypothetical protein
VPFWNSIAAVMNQNRLRDGKEPAMFTQLRQVFRYPFQSPDWQSRYWIGVALIFLGFIIPLVPFLFVGGYFMRHLRSRIRGQELALPTWDDWGSLALDGLRQMVVTVVFMLPGFLVLFGGQILYFLTFFGATIAASTSDPNNPAPYLAMFGSMGIMFLSLALGTLLMFLGIIPLPMALAHCAAKESLGAAFHFREWWRLLRLNAWDYFIAWVVIAGLGMVLFTALTLAYYTLILICLVPFLMALIGFYVLLVYGSLFGQVYRDSQQMVGAEEIALID